EFSQALTAQVAPLRGECPAVPVDLPVAVHALRHLEGAVPDTPRIRVDARERQLRALFQTGDGHRDLRIPSDGNQRCLRVGDRTADRYMRLARHVHLDLVPRLLADLLERAAGDAFAREEVEVEGAELAVPRDHGRTRDVRVSRDDTTARVRLVADADTH